MVQYSTVDREHHHHHDSEKERYVKYRSIVSSISFNTRFDTNLMNKCKWTHIGGNILRLPPIRRKFSLVNKVIIGNKENGIHSVAFSPKGRFVALGLQSGEIQLRRLSTITQNEATVHLRNANTCTELNSSVTCVRFVPSLENIFFSSDLSGQIDVFDTERICKQSVLKENNEINSIDINVIGTRLVSGGKDSILRIYDAATGKIILATLPLNKRSLNADPEKCHQMRIYCIKFDPLNCNVFYSGGLDGYVKMWDLREGLESVKTIKGPYLRGDAIDICGNTLLTASWRPAKALDLWDISSGKHLEFIAPSNRASTLDAEFYECVRFFNGGKEGPAILVGGSGNGRFEVVNMAERRVDFGVKVGNSVRSIDSTYSSIVCGSLDGICRVVKYNRIESDTQ